MREKDLDQIKRDLRNLPEEDIYRQTYLALFGLKEVNKNDADQARKALLEVLMEKTEKREKQIEIFKEDYNKKVYKANFDYINCDEVFAILREYQYRRCRLRCTINLNKTIDYEQMA